MTEIDIITNVDEFAILNNQIYVGNDKCLIIYDINVKIIRRENIGVFFLKRFNKHILLQLKEEKDRENVYIIDWKKLPNLILTHSFIENSKLYILDSNRSISKFDENLNRIGEYHNIGRFPTFFVDKYYFRIVNNCFFCFQLSNNDQIWQRSFSEFIQAEQVVLRHYFVHNDKLFFHLRSNGLPQNKYVSVVLDAHTGEELYQTEEPLGKKVSDEYGYTLADQYVWITDLKTYEVKCIDLTKELVTLDKVVLDSIGEVELGEMTVKFRFSPQYFDVEYPYLYFSEQRGQQVGVLNLETKEIIFSTEIEEDSLLKDLKVSQGKMYVHTTKNNLYVFG